MEEADLDGDGNISYDEFAELMKGKWPMINLTFKINIVLYTTIKESIKQLLLSTFNKVKCSIVVKLLSLVLEYQVYGSFWKHWGINILLCYLQYYEQNKFLI